ncbi:hypothetical protein IFM89_021641 [Coptis chinensis]|uniref:F-box domain-containing protein n=1 Tax=Coptis chinensis TaxID=261450 RepID=A0A835M141_9MAGN|nr:hypothetical protein IFM89_021641 [Coptis chinensis]
MTSSKRRGTGRGVCWWKFPPDITFNIFSRLPLQTLRRCRRMLKEWRIIISDPHLINTHLIRSSQVEYPDILILTKNKFYFVNRVSSIEESVKGFSLPKDLKSSIIINTCNGLLCSHRDNKTHVWNPFTREVMHIPPSRDTPKVLGFGFDPILNQYKVVAFFISSNNVEVEVFTIGSSSWKKVTEVPFVPDPSYTSVLLNGSLHWSAWCMRSKRMGIGCFAIGDEEFRFVPLPSAAVSVHPLDLSVLGGSLALAEHVYPNRVVVWLLKQQEGKMTWSKQFVLWLPAFMSIESLHLLYLLKNGEIILEYNHQKLVSFDPQRRQIRDIKTYPRSFETCAFLHVGSLVSPIIGTA